MEDFEYSSSYNGNSLLKPIGFEMSFTIEQVTEILKCKDDPVYFIEKYCKII